MPCPRQQNVEYTFCDRSSQHEQYNSGTEQNRTDEPVFNCPSIECFDHFFFISVENVYSFQNLSLIHI